MRTEIKYGLIFGAGICLYTLSAHLLGFYTTDIQIGKYGDIVIILLPIVVIFLAIREKRQVDGSLSLFQGIKTGLLVALVSFPISTIFLWIYHHYINPNWLEFIIEYERGNMVQAGLGASDTAARINAIRAGNSDFAQVVGGFVGTIVIGFIISLVISLILRRRKN